jgi:16S rRNA (uracil1498-N3)-methyltransferase
MRDRPGRVPRLFVGVALAPRSRLPLPDDAAHHAVRVLRLENNDAVTLFDGQGGEYAAHLVLQGRQAMAEVGEFHDVARESPLGATLVQGISSSEKMDFTVQKAVELGVVAVQPVLTAKSLVRLNGEREAKKLERWRRIAIAACEQCGRNRVPAVLDPLPLERYRPPTEGARILLSPSASEPLSRHARGPVTLAAGPEAGFSADEEQMLVRSGFVPVRLGPRVLRTETAALAALAALNALAGDF